jgi:hypothetical protein
MNNAQSLFEVIFAIAIAALVMTAVVVLSTDSVRNSSFSRNQTHATRHAQEATEWLREERDSSWINFANRTGNPCVSSGSWGVSCEIPGVVFCLGNLNWSSGCNISGSIFDRQVNLDLIELNNVEADIVVSWTDGQGTHEVRSITRFTNWR